MTKVAETKKSEIKLTELTIDEVLEIVLRPLQLNFGICLIILLGHLGATYILGNQTTLANGTPDINIFKTPTCILNTAFISLKGYGLLNGIVFLGLSIFIIISAIKFNPVLKFKTLMITSIIILFLLVYSTGGILDSPFSSAVGVYVASYFIIQDRNDLKAMNTKILLLVLTLTILPYFLFIFGHSTQHYIIVWNTDLKTNVVRLFLVILLIGFAGYSSNKVNKELTEALNKKNNIKNN